MRLNHRFRVLAAGAIALLLAAAPLAAQNRVQPDRIQSEGGKTVPPEGSKMVKGTIVFIQKDTAQFLLKTDDGKEFIFTADGGTRVRNLERDAQGVGIKLTDLNEGLVTSVTYMPKSSHYQAIYIDALGRSATVSRQDTRPRDPAKDTTAKEPEKPSGVEPIKVEGKIERVESDLSAVAIKTFDDKIVEFIVEEELRAKLKKAQTGLPDLSKGTEVMAMYVVEDGKNKLVVLRDLVIPNKPGAAPPPAPGSTQTTKTTTERRQGAGQPVGVAPLPVFPAALPAGFVANTQNPLGALDVRILQITGDMVVVTTGAAPARPGAPLPGDQQPNPNPPGGTNPPGGVPGQPGQPVPPAGTGTPKPPSPPFRDKKDSGRVTNPGAGQPGSGQPGAGQPAAGQPGAGQPAAGQPGANNADARGMTMELFVLLGVNSKEPYVVDQQTQITMGNQNQAIRFENLREGAEIQATFEVLANGRRHVRLITVLREGGPVFDPARPNQPQRPPANPPANAGNVLLGRVARHKGDLLFLQIGAGVQPQGGPQALNPPAGGGQFAVLMIFNSVEPLRMDDATRFSVDGREARFTDLQVGMSARVFLEMFNNVRRVIGVAAAQNGAGLEAPRRP